MIDFLRYFSIILISFGFTMAILQASIKWLFLIGFTIFIFGLIVYIEVRIHEATRR